MKTVWSFLIGIFLVLMMWLLHLPTQAQLLDATKVQQQKAEVKAKQKLSEMSLQQKIGQMFVFSYYGTDLHPVTVNLLKNFQPGALITFKNNIKNMRSVYKMNMKMQTLSMKYSGVPLLIMLDQEGGRVSRIGGTPFPPSALSIGSTKDLRHSFSTGSISGSLLYHLGFNMNLAPVVDLSDPFQFNFIGQRSFGDNPAFVTEMAMQFAHGLLSEGVLPTFKHFPGHGGIQQDSHKKTPVKFASLSDLERTDLVPYKTLSEANLPSAIMVAHISFPNIDPSGVPATFSKVMIDGVLRRQLGYSGIVITDDIQMSGAKVVGTIGECAVEAIQAGNDLIMVTGRFKRQVGAISSVLNAVKKGELSEQRIDQSVLRILKTKYLTVKEDNFKILPEKKFNQLTNQDYKKLRLLTHKITKANVAISQNTYSKLTGSIDEKDKLLVFSADGNFLKSLKKNVKNKILFYPLSKSKRDPVEGALSRHPDGTPIYYVTGRGTARRLKQLSLTTKNRLIVINTTHPGTIGELENFRAVYNINTRNYRSGEWVMAHLLKKRLPGLTVRQPASSKKTN